MDSYLRDKIGTNDDAWPGVRVIAEQCGMSQGAAIRGVQCLESCGELQVIRGRGRPNRYTMTAPTMEAVPHPEWVHHRTRSGSGTAPTMEAYSNSTRPTIQNAAAPPFSLSSDKTTRKKKKATKGRPTWLTPFWDAWKESFGGAPAAGPLARALKPLVTEHGEPKTLANWRVFLAKQDAAYIGPGTPGKFSSTFGSWNGKPSENSHVRDPTLDDDLERTRKLIAEDQEHGRQVREQRAKRKTEK